MTSIDPASARELLEAVIAGFSILGGGMAYLSGSNAAQAIAQGMSPEVIAHRINEAIGRGYEIFAPISVAGFVVMMVAS